jgi:hypothetical protein
MEDNVDFIERWFGISPDGGDGSTELMYVIAVLLVVAVAAFFYLRSRRTG